MSCAKLEAWLNEGMPQAGGAEARNHAARCPRCAAALEAAEQLEAMLLIGPGPAPADFTERVMARLGESLDRARALPVRALLPWWIRAAAEPAAVLAMLVGALVAWRWEALWSLTAATAAGLARWPHLVPAGWAGVARSASVRGALGEPLVQLGLELALLCLAVLSFPSLYHWTSGFTARAIPTRGRSSGGA
ncbi:MAG TPA: hypothetical protein VGK93_01505 [Candidatus Eisenbacteria bacterium]